MKTVFVMHGYLLQALLHSGRLGGCAMPFSDYRTALVTGGSAGIGAAIVERLSAEGVKVHAVSRNAPRLKALAAKTGCVAHAIDITDVKAVEQLLKPLEIDILVNNAGVSRAGNIATMDAFGIDEQVDVNLKAALHLIRLILPGMIDRDCGHVVNITSIAGLYNFSGNTVYHATKAAMHMVSQQTRVAAYGKRVRVTEIVPGRAETEIFGKVIGDMEAAKKQFYDGYESLKVEDVADAVAYAIGTPRHVNIGQIEIMPTFQVPGGLNFERRTGELPFHSNKAAAA
jgi:NADP-dependent 3-hydroxy acid dehydrogenase YdfG